MKPLYARPLTEEERRHLRQRLKARSGFTVRRAQMILKSADDGLKVGDIAQELGCSDQTVREALHAFHHEGLRCLEVKKAGRKDDQRAFDDAGREHLRELIRRSPRDYGHESSLWTLDLLAATSVETGLVQTTITGETVRATLVAMGINWRRAKKRITSPDKHYERKKSGETG
jgi:transposase